MTTITLESCDEKIWNHFPRISHNNTRAIYEWIIHWNHVLPFSLKYFFLFYEEIYNFRKLLSNSLISCEIKKQTFFPMKSFISAFLTLQYLNWNFKLKNWFKNIFTHFYSAHKKEQHDFLIIKNLFSSMFSQFIQSLTLIHCCSIFPKQ